MSVRIHPTAIVSPDATLADDVEIGPYCVIDGPAVIGPGCILRPFAHIVGRVAMGADNDVGTNCVLGDRPQHRGYHDEDTGVIIGRGNIFREHVTVHRGMPNARVNTVIGDDNFFMASSHVAHDCQVGSHCTFANGALLAGHVTVDDRVFISGNAAVHQNCRIGRLALISGISAASQDIPPFWILRDTNRAVGINVIGMRRSGMPTPEILGVRAAFRMLYQDRQPIRVAMSEMEERFAHLPAVMDVVRFIRSSKRGVPGALHYQPGGAMAA